MYVGLISDIELTHECDFLSKLEDKPGVSIMADRGFMIQEMLDKLNINLNVPPFLDKRQQLEAMEIEKGRKTASLRKHIERAIGGMKTYRETIPISMVHTWIVNQIFLVMSS